MIGVIAVARIVSARGPEPEQMIARQKIEAALSGVEGYLGDSLWENLDGAGEYMALFEYSSAAAVERGAIATATLMESDEVLHATELPVDLSFVDVKVSSGQSPAELFIPSFLSVSHRVASPGRGHELEEEMDAILAQLQYIPGCLGTMRAVRTDINEEIVCFASWATKAAYDDSLPDRENFYDLRLYQKIE